MTTENALDNTLLLANCAVKINGTNVSVDFAEDLISVEVVQSLYLPNMFTIRLFSRELKWFDSTAFKIGDTVEIAMGQSNNATATVFKGELTTLELDAAPLGIPSVTVRGYDKSHRLHRNRRSRTFLQVSDSDLVSQIGGEAGLAVEATDTGEVFPFVAQNNETDFEFLQRRAQRIGWELFCDPKTEKLTLRKHQNGSKVAVITWGEDLLRFTSRITSHHQTAEVIVRGWDAVTKAEIVGTASTPVAYAAIGLGKTGNQLASNFGTSKVYTVYRLVNTQSEAQNIAQSILNDLNGRSVQVEAGCFGNPVIKAGEMVELKGLGTRTSGNYYVSECTHRYSAEGYIVDFQASGRQSHNLLELTGQFSERGSSEAIPGVVVGLVSNNKDEEGKMGRVKLKFPWLNDTFESNWARIASPMAGAGRGFMFMPEVNDEVLVAFEHGDINRPYVIGVLWNGKDAPPKAIGEVVGSDGKVNLRTIKTRSGHIITFNDSEDAPGIEIIDKTGNNKITIDSTSNKISIISDGDIEYTATKGKILLDAQNIEFKASQNIKATATQNIDLKATQNLTAEATQNVAIKANMNVKVESSLSSEIKGGVEASLKGAKITVKGDAAGTVDGGAMLEVKGALLKLN